MKNFVLLLVLVVSFLVSSCESKSGRKVEEAKKQKEFLEQKVLKHKNDSIANAKDNEARFREGLILSGVIFLEGKNGGETSPRIEFGIYMSSEYYVSLVLINSLNVEGAPNGNGIPLDVAMKVKEIVQKRSQKENFYFMAHDNGYVYYGFWGVDHSKDDFNDDSLEQSLKLISAIEKETGWKFIKGSWKAY